MGLASPDAKQTNSRTLGYHCNLMGLLDTIDSADNNNSNPEDTHNATNDVEGELRLNIVINYLEDEIRLKTQTENNIESTNENSSSEQMRSNKQGELTTHMDFEATTVTIDIEDFPYYDDVWGELGFFLDRFILDELRILKNDIYANSTLDIMYLDVVHGYIETMDVFYVSLWEDEIWH